MQTVLLVAQLLIAVSLIGVILIQRSAQDGGGLTGGGSTMGGLFTARGSANIITRTTAFLATLFILNSLALGYIASSTHNQSSVESNIPVSTAPVDTTVPAVPTVPTVPTDRDSSKGLEPKGSDTHATDVPQAPDVPVVPNAK